MLELVNVVAAALGAYAFGAVWYMALSGPWIAAAGIKVDAQGRPQGNGSPMPFVIGFVCVLIVAGMMRHIFGMAGLDSLMDGQVAGLGIGAFFIMPWLLMCYTYGMRPLALTLIDGSYAIVGCAIIGTVLVSF